MVLTLPQLLTLAAQCAPAVAPATLLSVAKVESGFKPFAIGVNRPRVARLMATSKAEAIATAERLIAQGGDVDLGLAQINSKNLARLGLSLADAFDPCRNLAASARLIAADYERAAPKPGTEQAALRTALSLYNTGDSQRGFRNGYVARVTVAAGRLVPALKTSSPASAIAPRPIAAAPAWDVFAAAPTPILGFVFTPQAAGVDH
jgi:type IV secretion system protein VirB1